MKESNVHVGDTDLTVREWGDPNGEPLVFWHGLNPFGALQLNEAGPLWAERGFRVIAPAAPGGGESPPLPDADAYRLTRLADLVADLATALRLHTISFVGWSWGASIGVHLAAAHPDLLAALVLLDAGHTDVEFTESREQLEQAFIADQQSYAFDTWSAFFAAARARVATWRPALEERFRAGMEEREGRIVARSDARAAAAALWGVVSEPPSATHARLAATGVPILLVRSEGADDTDALARFVAAVPFAEVRSVPAGHDLLADAPQTAELVADWLALVTS